MRVTRSLLSLVVSALACGRGLAIVPILNAPEDVAAADEHRNRTSSPPIRGSPLAAKSSSSTSLSAEDAKEPPLHLAIGEDALLREHALRREVAQQFKDKIREGIRRNRVRRGLSAEETPEERRSRRRRAREERREERRRRQLDRQHSAEDGNAFPAPGGHGRRMQSSQVLNSFIITLYPYRNTEVTLCAGVDNTKFPEEKDKLILRNLDKILEEVFEACDETLDSDDDVVKCLLLATHTFWQIELINEQMGLYPGRNNYNYFRENGPNYFAAWLPYIGTVYRNFYMETKKYRKGKHVRINTRNSYNILQTFDFRAGLLDLTDEDIVPVPMTRFTDHTYRPSRTADPTGNAIPGQELCFEPEPGDGKNITEGDNIYLQRCSTKQGKREKQIWLYCGADRDCASSTDDFDPPDFTVTVRCEETSTETGDCDEQDYKDQNIEQDGNAVDESLWEDFGDECNDDPDPDFKYGRSLVYRMEDFDDDEGMELTLTYGSDTNNECDSDDANVILRVFEESGSRWDCIYISSTDCDDGENNIEARIGDNGGDDFLVIVSTTGNDEKNLREFDLEIDCIKEDRTESNGLSEDSNDNQYCFQSAELNVEDEDMPSDWEDDKAEGNCKQESELDGSTIQNTSTIVDTRGIDFADSDRAIEIELDCDSTDRLDRIETLIRVYKIDEDADKKYTCEFSKILQCGGTERFRINGKQDLEANSKYLVVGSGPTKGECGIGCY